MTRYEVTYSQEATDALRAIFRYIAEHDGPGRAGNWIEEFRDRAKLLDTTPQAFSVITTRGTEDIRAKLILCHWLYYTIDEAARVVLLIDVAHTSHETKLQEYRDDE